MCTVSWVRAACGYSLFCNRDESRTRGPEQAPGIHERDGVRYLSPRDGDFGGTWVAANQFGVSVALLNGYTESRGAARSVWTSRGLLVDGLAHLKSAVEIRKRLQTADLAEYQPFQLLAIDAERGLEVLRWDGIELGLRPEPEADMPLVSSGVEAPTVRSHRQSLLAQIEEREGLLTVELLDSFHRNHDAGPSALSPCMHREDAETRSLSRVTVDQQEVKFDYTPGAPCQTEWVTPIRIPRRLGAECSNPKGLEG